MDAMKQALAAAGLIQPELQQEEANPFPDLVITIKWEKRTHPRQHSVWCKATATGPTARVEEWVKDYVREWPWAYGTTVGRYHQGNGVLKAVIKHSSNCD